MRYGIGAVNSLLIDDSTAMPDIYRLRKTAATTC